MEEHLHRNGTRIIKVFLNLSKAEQQKRLLTRIDDKEKNWKFSIDDIKERDYWKQYMAAYQDCLYATTSKHSPWFVVPADDKENARLIVSKILLKTLSELNMEYPRPSAKRKLELKSIRNRIKKQN